MTAEQKFLKALAEYTRYMADYKNEASWKLAEAGKDYLASLDHITDSSKKVDASNSLKEYAQPFKGVLDTLPISSGTAPEFNGCNCSMQYLAIGHNEPETTWKPEVGMLYKEQSGLIGECTNISFGDDVIYIRYLGDKEGFCLSKGDFTPIAELEGLGVTDYVYSASGERWFIDDIDCEVITVNGDGIIPIDVDGVPYSIANQQLFWRTADRAERLGKVDE